MSTITEILDRLSGIAAVKERMSETARNVDKSLAWLLDHEKRLIRMESAQPGPTALPSPPAAPALPKTRKRD